MLSGALVLSCCFPARTAAREAAMSLALRRCRGGKAGLEVSVSTDAARSNPVSTEHVRRRKRDRQSIMRTTRAGRECQESITVPRTKTTRFEVMIYSGGSVRTYQTGVSSNIRISRTVKAGRVVADVAVRWIDRKSVRRRKGSSKMLQRDVNSFMVSTISSKLL